MKPQMYPGSTYLGTLGSRLTRDPFWSQSMYLGGACVLDLGCGWADVESQNEIRLVGLLSVALDFGLYRSDGVDEFVVV
jgi:hypothetical protein